MAASERPMTIRRVGAAGLDDLVEAQNRIFADYIVPIRSSRAFFQDFLRSVGGEIDSVLVAVDGRRIVGYVTPVQDKQEGWIGGIGVMPEHRNRGLGTALMAAAEKSLKERGVTEVNLEVIEGNLRAQRLYERLGYRQVRKLLCAEGRPARLEGYGDLPERATLADIMPLHADSYARACWQRRKPSALAQSARDAEIYRKDGGFVMVRTVETNGFIPFLGVVSDRREKGIGTSLAMFALSRLGELGAFKASVFNVEETEPILRMLDKFDFRVTMKQIEMRKSL